MEDRIGIKEIELLIEKREICEQGLREEIVVVHMAGDTCYVLLTDQGSQFHIHRYFLLGRGFSSKAKWEVSYDVQSKSAIDTIRNLFKQLSNS